MPESKGRLWSIQEKKNISMSGQRKPADKRNPTSPRKNFIALAMAVVTFAAIVAVAVLRSQLPTHLPAEVTATTTKYPTAASPALLKLSFSLRSRP